MRSTKKRCKNQFFFPSPSSISSFTFNSTWSLKECTKMNCLMLSVLRWIWYLHRTHCPPSRLCCTNRFSLNFVLYHFNKLWLCVRRAKLFVRAHLRPVFRAVEVLFEARRSMKQSRYQFSRCKLTNDFFLFSFPLQLHQMWNLEIVRRLLENQKSSYEIFRVKTENERKKH